MIGHHAAITVAGQTGNFQLNVALPLIAANLLDSIRLLSNVSRLLADSAIAGLKLRKDNIEAALDRNPILVTALNPVIGYEKAAAIAKRAYKEGRAVFDVALEDSGLAADELKKLLDPAALTQGGPWGRRGRLIRGVRRRWTRDASIARFARAATSMPAVPSWQRAQIARDRGRQCLLQPSMPAAGRKA